MNIGVDKFWTQKKVPDAMHQLAFEMSPYIGRQRNSKCLAVKVFDRIGELRRHER
jgi:hypothetical protein